MKIKYYIALIIAAAALAAAALVLDPFHSAKLASSPSDNDGPVFSSERLKWEFMRLRDPKTGKIPYDIRRKELAFAMNLPGSISNLKYSSDMALGVEWRRRGPYNVGGRTRGLAIDVLDENVIIAGGVSGGIWRSVDGGQSWTKTTKPYQLQSVSCLVQDTRAGKEHIWYAGTGEFWGNSARIYGDGIYKSMDGGRNWTLLSSTSTAKPQLWDNRFEFVWRLAVNSKASADIDEVYAATAFGGIWRTIDGGESWAPVLGGFGNAQSWFTDIAISPDGVFYATMSQATFMEGNIEVDAETSGVFRSVDGVNWTDITPEFMPEKFNRIVIGIAHSDEKQVYFAAETPGSGKLTTNSRRDDLWHSLWKYTYLSGDGSGDGGIWEDRSEFIPKPDLIRGQMNSQGSYNLVIKVKPDDPDVVILGGTNLYRSSDGFSSDNFTWIGGTCPDPDDECWYIYRYPNQHCDQHEIVFLRSDSEVMFTGTDGGVHKTVDILADRVEWISLNSGYYTTQFYTCAIDRAIGGSEQILGGLQDNGTLHLGSSETTYPWTNPTHADGLTCVIANGGQVYYSSQNSSSSPSDVKIWRFLLDENGERTVRTRIDPAGGLDFIWNCPIILDPHDNGRMYLGGGKIVWRNNNLNDIPFVESKDSTAINWDSLTHTRISPDNPIVKRGGLISAMDVSTIPANIIYYGTTEGEIFRIDGAHEGDPEPIDVSGVQLPKNAYCSCIEIDAGDANRVFAVFNNYGVQSLFYTSDGGAVWEPVGGNLEETLSGGGTGPGCFWVKQVPVGDSKLYLVGTSTGLYSTAYLDGKLTVWRQEGAETIGNMVVRMIDARPSDGYTVAATHGGGVYSAYINALPAAPQTPVLSSPADGARGVRKYERLQWDSLSEAVFYRLEISKDPLFETIEFEYDGQSQTWRDGGVFEQGLVDYFWRVRAQGSGGVSEFSPAWKFTTAVAAPETVYPANAADSISIKPELRWKPVDGAESYHVQVDDNFNFRDLIVDTSGVAQASLAIDGLEYGEKYYWRVSAANSDGEGYFSNTSRFTTVNAVAVEDLFSPYGKAVLARNYPNPFSGVSIIEFELYIEAGVRLELFDARGKIVMVLKEGFLNAGRHSAALDASNIPAGTYFYRLTAGGAQTMRKLNVIK